MNVVVVLLSISIIGNFDVCFYRDDNILIASNEMDTFVR